MREESFRTPVTLSGRWIRQVPLDRSHAPALAPIWADPDVHRHMIGLFPGPGADRVDRLIEALLARQATGSDLAFTTVRVRDDRPIGMTRFLHIERYDDAVEIGGTWLDRRYWRTPCNTESKLLMLRHAFETEGAHRVSLQTDSRNLRSQRAIERIGAVREALLREDRHLWTGGYRSSVCFAIVRSEWPTVSKDLRRRLEISWDDAPRPVPGPPVLTEPERAGPAPEGARTPIDMRSPITLSGQYVDLVPLDRSHVPALVRAGRDPEVWRFLHILPGRTDPEMTRLVDAFLAERDQGLLLPFAIRAKADGVPVGIFRFLNIERNDRHVELGTWIDSRYWRSPYNTEVKYLGLRYAFERERVHRVVLRTDERNLRSQAAIERLGAVREGVHREHLRLPDGGHRTSIVYSLLESEWPASKQRLEALLERPWPGPSAGSTSATGDPGPEP